MKLIITFCSLFYFYNLYAGPIFETPSNYAPASRFQETSIGPGNPIFLPVRLEVINWVESTSLAGYVAYNNGSTTELLPITYIFKDLPSNSGVYLDTAQLDSSHPYYNQNLTGKFVVVTDALLDETIPTGFNQSLNSGRGGYDPLGEDPIGQITYSDQFDVIYMNQDNIFDQTSSIYTYNNTDYALFTDPNQLVPEFEKWIGENFSLYGVDRLAQMKFADEVIRRTGFPVVHRKIHSWFNGGAYYPHQNAPIFQVMHHWLTIREENSVMLNDDPNLASFIFGPNWKWLDEQQRAQEPHFAFYENFYDINMNIFIKDGLDYIEAMGNVFDNYSGKTSVAIFSEGGCSMGCRNLHISYKKNLPWLMQQAHWVTGADIYNLVAQGDSRGGAGVLNALGNEYNYDSNGNNAWYRIKYAMAINPPVKLGDLVHDFARPPYLGISIAMFEDTGYKFAHVPGWSEPNTGKSGSQLTAESLAGSYDRTVLNNLSPGSNLNYIQDTDTQLYITTGTHDGWFSQAVTNKFFQELLDFNQAQTQPEDKISFEYLISYRGGHNIIENLADKLTEFAGYVINGGHSFQNNKRHFKRDLTIPSNLYFPASDDLVEYSPSKEPVCLEASPLLVKGQSYPITFSGGSAKFYGLSLVKIYDSWQSDGYIAQDTSINPITITSGIFGTNYSRETFYLDYNVDQSLQDGWYIYYPVESDDAITWNPFNLQQTSLPLSSGVHTDVNSFPVVEVISSGSSRYNEIFSLTGKDFPHFKNGGAHYFSHNRSFGVCNE